MAPSRILFVVTQTLSALLGLCGLAVAFLSLYTGLNPFRDFLPSDIIQTTGVVSAFVLIVSLIGLFMVICQLDELFCLFLTVTFFQIVFNLGFFTVLTLFSLGEKTLPFFDDVLEEIITDFDVNGEDIAFNDLDGFQIVQNQLNCCGVNLESSFNDDQNATLTGTRCFDEVDGLSGIDALQAIRDLFANFNLNAVTEAAENTTLADEDFFCEPDLADLTSDTLRLLQIVFAFVILFEMISFLCACLIYCCVKREDGRMKWEEENDLNKVVLKATTTVKKGFTMSRSASTTMLRHIKAPSFDGVSSSFDENALMTVQQSSGNIRRNTSSRKKVSSFVMNLIAPFSASSGRLGGDMPPPPTNRISERSTTESEGPEDGNLDEGGDEDADLDEGGDQSEVNDMEFTTPRKTSTSQLEF